MREESDAGPSRDEAYDPQARTRDAVLRRVHARTHAAGETVTGPELARELGLDREETFRSLEYLAGRGLLDYLGAGPVVRISPRGSALVEACGVTDDADGSQ